MTSGLIDLSPPIVVKFLTAILLCDVEWSKHKPLLLKINPSMNQSDNF